MLKAPVTGVLLAGGQSRRMGGGDKGLLQLDGKSMLQHVLERLAPQVSALVLNANGDPGRFAGLGLPVVADPIAGYVGPLVGVLAGMRWSLAHAPEQAFAAHVRYANRFAALSTERAGAAAAMPRHEEVIGRFGA